MKSIKYKYIQLYNMMNPVIVSGYMGAGVGYIYGYMQAKNTEYPFPYNLYYSKKKDFPILYSIVGFISGGFLGKMFF